MTTPSPTKRVALGELPLNALSPRANSPRDFLKSKEAVIEIFRPGSPLKQTYTAEASPLGQENESRGKKRKAGDENGESVEEVKVVSPVLLRRSSDDVEAEAVEVPTIITTLEEHSGPEQTKDGSATPTPDNHAASQESTTSKISGSFSSLIDYHAHDSSERSSSPTECTTCEAPAELLSIQSKTEMLRLRLRVAMYKVRTNQTGLPLYAISVPSSSPSLARKGPQPRSRSSSPIRPTSANRSKPARPTAPVAAVAMASLSTIPRLGAAPVLLPTAYSSAHISYGPNLPSSPPQRSPVYAARAGYAAAVMEADEVVDARIEGEKGSEAGFETPAKRVRRVEEEGWGELTSSVVKGRIAAGLLELRRGG